jgi:hypothetical protein
MKIEELLSIEDSSTGDGNLVRKDRQTDLRMLYKCIERKKEDHTKCAQSSIGY